MTHRQSSQFAHAIGVPTIVEQRSALPKWTSERFETESQRGNVAHSHRWARNSPTINPAWTATEYRKPIPLGLIVAFGISAKTGVFEAASA
ncbi:MAG: hypothetical protein ACPGPS_17250 [Rubripirellula sp.]